MHTRATSYHTSPTAKASKQFLNSSVWLKLRDYKLSLVPWCELCAKVKPISVPATQVDHIQPRHTHPHLKLDLGNLQSICDECHGAKTRRGE
jgi:5-methylcytosine-specific restriction protein A